MWLLGYLMIHAGSAFSIADLERRTMIPQTTLSREVDRLARSGLVVTHSVGRNKLVEANESSPYFPELRSLLMKALGPASLLGERLSKVPGVEEAFIFGSWARRYDGELGPPPTDIDVLVIGDPDPDAVEAACLGARRRLSTVINPVVLSPHEWEAGRSGFVRQLRKGPLVPLARVR